MSRRMSEGLERQIMWRFPSKDLELHHRPYSWAGWGMVYMKWWQYWPVWGVSRPWRFSVTDACDGRRASKLVIIPFLGAFVWFFDRPCGCEEE